MKPLYKGHLLGASLSELMECLAISALFSIVKDDFVLFMLAVVESHVAFQSFVRRFDVII